MGVLDLSLTPLGSESLSLPSARSLLASIGASYTHASYLLLPWLVSLLFMLMVCPPHFVRTALSVFIYTFIGVFILFLMPTLRIHEIFGIRVRTSQAVNHWYLKYIISKLVLLCITISGFTFIFLRYVHITQFISQIYITIPFRLVTKVS